MRNRTTLVPFVVALALATLAGCAGESSPKELSSTDGTSETTMLATPKTTPLESTTTTAGPSSTTSSTTGTPTSNTPTTAPPTPGVTVTPATLSAPSCSSPDSLDDFDHTQVTGWNEGTFAGQTEVLGLDVGAGSADLNFYGGSSTRIVRIRNNNVVAIVDKASDDAGWHAVNELYLGSQVTTGTYQQIPDSAAWIYDGCFTYILGSGA